MSLSRLGSRTVRESWPLTRLLSNVAFVRGTRTARVSRRLAIVTVTVEQLEVVFPRSPPAGLGGDVIHFHPIVLPEEQTALGALAVLALQESCDSRRDLRMVPKASTPIHPIAIIGTTHTVNLHVPPDHPLPVSI
jgi:hypothetical protein